MNKEKEGNMLGILFKVLNDIKTEEEYQRMAEYLNNLNIDVNREYDMHWSDAPYINNDWYLSGKASDDDFFFAFLNRNYISKISKPKKQICFTGKPLWYIKLKYKDGYGGKIFAQNCQNLISVCQWFQMNGSST